MHVLMISLIDDRVVPGQDDCCEILDTARSLTAAGVSMTVVIDRPIAAGVRGRAPAFEVISIPRLGVIPIRRAARMPLAALLQTDLAALAEVFELWRDGQRWDVIHCFGWRAGTAAGLLSRLMGLPLVASVRDDIADRSDWLEDHVEAYSRHIWRWLFPRCEAIICPDEYQKEKIADLFLVGDRRIAVVPSVCDGDGRRGGMEQLRAGGAGPAPSSSDAGPAPNSGGGERRILYHGDARLTPGLRHLLAVFARLSQRPDVSLRMFLAGPAGRLDQTSFRGLLRRLDSADRIAMLKPRTETGWWDTVLSAMDLMILPGSVSFIGNLIWKAMVRGCPLLASGESPLSSWFGDRGLQEAVWQEGRELEDRCLERALLDEALRERLSGVEKNLVRGVRFLGERLAGLYKQVCRKGGAESEKGGEHHAVRVAENGSRGGLR